MGPTKYLLRVRFFVDILINLFKQFYKWVSELNTQTH